MLRCTICSGRGFYTYALPRSMQSDAIRHVWIEYLLSDGRACERNPRKGSEGCRVVVASE